MNKGDDRIPVQAKKVELTAETEPTAGTELTVEMKPTAETELTQSGTVRKEPTQTTPAKARTGKSKQSAIVCLL